MSLRPGLVLVRYVLSDVAAGRPDGETGKRGDEGDDKEAGAPPTIVLELDGAADHIVCLPEPGAPADTLTRPGQCLVIRIAEPVEIALKIRAARPDGRLDAQVQIAYLTGEAACAPAMPLGAVLDPVLSGHLARMGDVTAAIGGWLGGPDNPVRIEGVSLAWPDRPEGLELRYGAADSTDAALVPLGRFVGSRGQARALMGLRIVLAGPAASGWEIVAEALFLGCAAIEARGPDVRLAGTRGTEPLLGLRLSIVRTRG